MDDYACGHSPCDILLDADAIGIVHNMREHADLVAVDTTYGDCGVIESVALSSAYWSIWLRGYPYAVGRLLRDPNVKKVHWDVTVPICNATDLAKTMRDWTPGSLCPKCRAANLYAHADK
jgi:hypothetical protein